MTSFLTEKPILRLYDKLSPPEIEYHHLTTRSFETRFLPPISPAALRSESGIFWCRECGRDSVMSVDYMFRCELCCGMNIMTRGWACKFCIRYITGLGKWSCLTCLEQMTDFGELSRL